MSRKLFYRICIFNIYKETRMCNTYNFYLKWYKCMIGWGFYVSGKFLLNLIPKRSFKKGENSISPHTQELNSYLYDLNTLLLLAEFFSNLRRERANSIEQIRTRKNVINFSFSALISFSYRVQPINIWQMPKGFHNIIPSSCHYPIFNRFFQNF